VAEGSKVKFVEPLERKPKPAATEPEPQPEPKPSPAPVAPTDYSATDAYIARMEADLEDKVRGRMPPKVEPVLGDDPYGTKEWQQRYQRRNDMKLAAKEWDAAHPELFEDKPAAPRTRELTESEEAERADYDAWYEASLDEEAA
jgi:hypothetical protein